MINIHSHHSKYLDFDSNFPDKIAKIREIKILILRRYCTRDPADKKSENLALVQNISPTLDFLIKEELI